jgi:predicted MFS family arabinose efflux permease
MNFGGIVHRFGYRAGFLFPAFVATMAFVLLWVAMPETREIKREPLHVSSGC